MMQAHSTGTAPADRIDPRTEPAAWVANNERITNGALREEWEALYAPDAVLETYTEGVHARTEGIDDIRAAIEVYAGVFTARRLRVSKRLICATEDTVVNAWTGGFDGRTDQRGVEAFHLRADGLVAYHEMYTLLSPRPETSLSGRLRSLLAAPRPMLTLARLARRAG